MMAFALAVLLCACVPAALFVRNLTLYREPPSLPPAGHSTAPAVSILIPARNEAAGIEQAVRRALLSRGCSVEVIVMDDHSTDATAAIVQQLALDDPRVCLAEAPTLTPGWNGKQHACWALAHVAQAPIFCFVDADVRLAPDCVARMAALIQQNGNALVSGFPRQVTGTPLEWLLLPLIHFVLLGFLPLGSMRRGTNPAYAAGCGQFIMARREPYFASGGHNGIRLTMHDGLRLPHLFRQHDFHTDLADLTHLATCRMYTTAAGVWNGLAKNATEGIAAPARIVPVTLVLLLGQVMPFFAPLLLLSREFSNTMAYYQQPRPADWSPTPPHAALLFALFIAACVCAWLPRWLAARRFHQDWRSALLHPIGILVLLAIQWYAFLRKLAGHSVTWRDRAYTEA